MNKQKLERIRLARTKFETAWIADQEAIMSYPVAEDKQAASRLMYKTNLAVVRTSLALQKAKEQ